VIKFAGFLRSSLRSSTSVWWCCDQIGVFRSIKQ